jgi:hypothetical protein
MCQHQPPCPPADAPDREAAHVVASHPEQGWSLLCNGVVAFEDTGVLLPNGQSIPPRPPAHTKVTVRLPLPPRLITGPAAGLVGLTCARSLSANRVDHNRRPATLADSVWAQRLASVLCPIASASIADPEEARSEHPPLSEETQVRISAGHRAKGGYVEADRICNRQRPVRWWQESLTPDVRDPDIVCAKQLARRTCQRRVNFDPLAASEN